MSHRHADLCATICSCPDYWLLDEHGHATAPLSIVDDYKHGPRKLKRAVVKLAYGRWLTRGERKRVRAMLRGAQERTRP